jgi:DNA-binding MarR family transcriptional regulator
MTAAPQATRRNERKPRHGWFDYEVLDVFGDELGPYGITVYTVLARLCYGGFRVTMGLRELAAHARMKKDSLARTLKRMIELGLVVEQKGRTGKSVSSYDLTDVKDLVEQMRALARERAASASSVSDSDRSTEGSAGSPEEKPEASVPPDRQAQGGDAAAGTHGGAEGTAELEASDVAVEADADCLPQRQMEAEGAEAVQNAVGGPETGVARETDLSQNGPRFETHLSQSASRVNWQEGSKQRSNKNTPPLPPLPPPGGVKENLHSREAAPDGTQDETRWASFIAELKREMCDEMPIGVELAKHWKELHRGQSDFKSCFGAWWLLEVERGTQAPCAIFSTYAADEAATQAGIAKYEKRLKRLLRRFFALAKDTPIEFLKVLRSEERTPGEAERKQPAVNGEIPEGDREAWMEVQRLAKEHLAKLAKVNPAIKLEWIHEGVEPAQLESVESVNGGRVWKLRSPAPATTRVVMELLKEPVLRRVAAGVRIEIAPEPGAPKYPGT